MDQTFVSLAMREAKNSAFPGFNFPGLETALVLARDEESGVASSEAFVQIQDESQLGPAVPVEVVSVRGASDSGAWPSTINMRPVSVSWEITVKAPTSVQSCIFGISERNLGGFETR
jgi:hypothetical protein